MNLYKRIIVILIGLLTIMVSMQACRLTSRREKILNNGEIVKTKITKTISDGNTKTLNVKISEVEYSAGEAFGEYNNKVTGDSVSVFYLKNMDYVVLTGEKKLLNSFIFEIIVVLGGLLVFYGVFSKESNYNRYLPYTMRIDLDEEE